MIDIHTHILPNIDDGSTSIAESLELIDREIKAGVDTIVCTPHLMPGVFDNTLEIADKKIEELLSLPNFPRNVKLISGLEIQVHPELLPNIRKNKEKYTINGAGKYILLELPYYDRPLYLNDFLFDLSILDIKVILAHIERYIYFWETPEEVRELIENGVIIQMNVEALFIKKDIKGRFINYLIKNNLVHLYASDVHSVKGTRPLLDRARSVLLERKGEEYAELLLNENPRCILEGKVPQLPKIKDKQYKKRWKLW